MLVPTAAPNRPINKNENTAFSMRFIELRTIDQEWLYANAIAQLFSGLARARNARSKNLAWTDRSERLRSDLLPLT